MDIDLLLTTDGEPGLISDAAFGAPVAGIMFDANTRMFTIEFGNADMDPLDLNIPVSDDHLPALLYAPLVHVGVIHNGRIEESRQVPLLLINDPDDAAVRLKPQRPGTSVLALEKFLKSCNAGQPVHREDLGDESSAESVMAGMNRAVLQFAPQLARQRTLEAQPHLAPQAAPGMGLGGGGGGGRPVSRGTPQKRGDDGRD